MAVMECRDNSDSSSEENSEDEGSQEVLVALGQMKEPEEVDDPPPVRMLLLAFMFMFQGYGAMVGNPQHALKVKLELGPDQAGAFQDATASFQLAKLSMRILQIAFLVFLRPNGIVYVSYVVMFIALMVPTILVWGAGVTDLWVVYLQYSLGGIAIGLFEGTFLSVISSLGKNTKTFAIMGAPLGFAVHNIILSTFHEAFGMPIIVYYLYSAFCIPFGVAIFYVYAPGQDAGGPGKGCSVFCNSMKHASAWVPAMIPWFIAKFIGNFVLEDGFPLLFNTFNTHRVPIWGGPDSTMHTIPFQYYTAWIWFPMMAAGDTISRRVPQYILLESWRTRTICILLAVFMCVLGEALTFLLLALVTAFAAFISNFGNGFIYGLSAKYIDGYIPQEHRYAAYNLWCFCGDLGGYAGQSSMSVSIAHKVCDGRHYEYVCHSRAPKTAGG
eukprot:CAMPEP_0115053092 /NCGR_PEP_ID=MMETSP0227-20121206/3310_1 /TAXON_ID=89957 /ORGANISM="Polarella glacialis, Strain CCMP 1383" /LENGTH=440 /DNA_ID=CAMNT_0002437345 /DNA_START=49 /DNA_END=1371 /DNA_ORIENTATION=-